MEKIKFKIVAFILVVVNATAFSQKSIATKLKNADNQTVVVYGASVASASGSRIWVDGLFDKLKQQYPGKLSCYNVSKSGENSYWATENFKDSILSKKPDVLIFGFCENDCVERFNYWPWYSGRCAEYMIDKLKNQNKDAIVIMYIMSEFPIGDAAKARPDIKAFNNSYRDIAKRRNILLVDFSADFKSIYDNQGEKIFKLYQVDGIMPSKKAANEIIIPGFLKAMKIQ